MVAAASATPYGVRTSTAFRRPYRLRCRDSAAVCARRPEGCGIVAGRLWWRQPHCQGVAAADCASADRRGLQRRARLWARSPALRREKRPHHSTRHGYAPRQRSARFVPSSSGLVRARRQLVFDDCRLLASKRSRHEGPLPYELWELCYHARYRVDPSVLTAVGEVPRSACCTQGL